MGIKLHYLSKEVRNLKIKKHPKKILIANFLTEMMETSIPHIMK